MNHEEVKLTRGQTFKIALKAFDSTIPWKRTLAFLGVSAINFFYVLPMFPRPGNTVQGFGDTIILMFLSMVATTVELICITVVCLLLFLFCEPFINAFKKEFQDHKEKTQKKILDTVDQEILR